MRGGERGRKVRTSSKCKVNKKEIQYYEEKQKENDR